MKSEGIASLSEEFYPIVKHCNKYDTISMFAVNSITFSSFLAFHTGLITVTCSENSSVLSFAVVGVTLFTRLGAQIAYSTFNISVFLVYGNAWIQFGYDSRTMTQFIPRAPRMCRLACVSYVCRV